MDSDFVEEFDTSSSESESGESLAKQPKFDEVASSSTAQVYPHIHHVLQPYPIPPPPYHPQVGHPVNYDFPPVSMYDHSQSPYHPPQLPFAPYFAHNRDFRPQSHQIQPAFPYASAEVAEVLYNIPTSVNTCKEVVVGTDEPTAIKRKKRRHSRNTLKLSDYDDSVRSHAWKIYQKKRLELKWENCTKESRRGDEGLQISQSLEAIKKDLSTYKVSQDESTLSKILNKIKTQRQKRLRDKVQRKKKSEEKQKNLELSKKKEAEIDKWLKDQAIAFDSEKKHQLFLKEAKKSLAQLIKRRGMIEDRMNLLFNLQKLREVRKNQMINTQPSFSESSLLSSDQKFEKEYNSLHNMLQTSLSQIQDEEKTIRLNMTPIATSVPKDDPTAATVTDLNLTPTDSDRKLKRQMKWEKYLRKKGKLDVFREGCGTLKF